MADSSATGEVVFHRAGNLKHILSVTLQFLLAALPGQNDFENRDVSFLEKWADPGWHIPCLKSRCGGLAPDAPPHPSSPPSFFWGHSIRMTTAGMHVRDRMV
jgi:hypothetical protein